MIRCLLIRSGILTTLLLTIPVAYGQNSGQQKYDVLIETGPAYYRVTVTTDPAIAVNQTETFQVVYTTRDYRGANNVVHAELEIPAGQVSGTTDIYTLKNFPDWGNQSWIHIEQDNNGRFNRRRDLCETSLVSNNSSQMYPKKFLVASSKISAAEGMLVKAGSRAAPNQAFNNQVNGAQPIPNVGKLAGYLQELSGNNWQTGSNNYSMFQNYAGLLYGIPLGSLPERWLGLYNVEMILISMPDLEQACRANPAVRDAIRHWLAVGGTLVVNDCGTDLAAAPKILPTLFGPESGLLPQQMQVEWAVPTKKFENYISRDFSQTVHGSLDAQIGVDAWHATDQFENEYWAMAPYLKGSVFAVSDDMSNTTDPQWREMINAHNVLKGEDWQLDQNGMGFDRSLNRDFKIPSVGDPPVVAFQLLLTLFVILAGPVFFLFFKRAKKMHLLFFATPLLSLIACLGMFLFAVLSDGFSKQGRVETVTFLDQSTGDAVASARHAFYAGVQPSGYVFNDNTLVMDSRRDDSPVSRFRYRNDQVLLTGGEIRARTRHQVVTNEPLETERRLNFIPNKDQSGVVQNLMGTDIELFCIHTRSGWLIATNIAQDESVSCEKTDFIQVNQKVKSIVTKQTPNTTYTSQADYPSVTSVRAAERLIYNFRNMTWGESDIGQGQYIAILKQTLTSSLPDPEVDYKTNELHIVIGTL